MVLDACGPQERISVLHFPPSGPPRKRYAQIGYSMRKLILMSNRDGGGQMAANFGHQATF
jgi:hypothetical protein